MMVSKPRTIINSPGFEIRRTQKRTQNAMNFLCPHVWFATKNSVFQRLWGGIEVLRGLKLGLKKGKLFMDLLTEMNKAIAEAKAIEALVPMGIDTE